MVKRILAKSYLWVLLIILYAPIAIITIFSFTKARVLGNWSGFSLQLYKNIFEGHVSDSISSAMVNTFSIATFAALISTVLGTFAAIGIFNLRGRTKQGFMLANSIPILNADIITGVALFLLFISLGFTQGYTTVLLAHISFCTPYVVLSVLPHLKQMNPNLYEAALDLGATPFTAFRKIVVPYIRTGMLSGFILAFTLSLDDFAVTLFTKGNSGVETLSTYIYADARKGGLTPELRPLTTIIFLSVLTLLIVINLRANKQSKKH